MIQIIGIIEILIFYIAYFLKLSNQKSRGIKTNQLGEGNKLIRTIIIEKLLRIFSTVITIVMMISAITNTFLFESLIIRGLGLMIFGLGTCIFITAMITMQDNWRAGIPDQDKTTMVTSGIYKISRNPAFLGFDLTYIGVSITFGNVVLIIMAVLAVTLMHLQILEEEEFLEETFGSQYSNYKKRVGRYFIFI
ncbi:methyltransferase family protein [Anaerocolumna xylanovorans]|uniref:Phospholipid methyltransferase n=1 Tax=Anaerocolumna xylanovorans DSM 12503 TaxID=1121345 RepID=A0A1M7Y645_9FIRM|nr:isoprenylcysteine carboxylmethyltransferase family protein [Anaerocolumna xylanovorans]SHO48109.1 Phospholipid methyltransferase [Anaerocolumna xylanovorans DSM 12503]